MNVTLITVAVISTQPVKIPLGPSPVLVMMDMQDLVLSVRMLMNATRITVVVIPTQPVTIPPEHSLVLVMMDIPDLVLSVRM
jgi:hypothetical protein